MAGGRRKIYTEERKSLYLRILPSQHKEIEKIAKIEGKTIPIVTLKLIEYGLNFCEERKHLDVRLLPSQHKEIEELASVEGKSTLEMLEQIIDYGLTFCKLKIKDK